MVYVRLWIIFHATYEKTGLYQGYLKFLSGILGAEAIL